jgi:putative ABC transport system permease protein
VQIIGIMNRGPSETYAGIWLSESATKNAFKPLFTRYYLRMTPGVNGQAEAKKIEQVLGEYGVAAKSIKRQVEEDQALNSSFFYLVQGFMALGFGVGLAALGVIAFRTTVERRQQIGLMRAIGFSQLNVALTFLLESAFIAVLGIANGIWLALLLANRLLSSREFTTAGFTTFHVPWLEIALMSAGVFVASVLTTLIPSRQASTLPIAEALRYE